MRLGKRQERRPSAPARIQRVDMTPLRGHIRPTDASKHSAGLPWGISVYQQLMFGELSPTRVTIQLAVRLVKVPKGEINDVFIQVGEYIYSVDFIVLKTQPISNLRSQTPIILGHLFFATANAIINCRNRSMRLTFGDMTKEVNVFNLKK